MALRIALFGQAAFGRDVLVRVLEAGHTVVGVFAPPPGRRPDPLAEEAEGRGLPLFRHARYRRQGQAIPERVEEYRALGAELNLLAFVTVILPVEIVDGAPQGSLCFHPSLLPRFRGGAALAWQIIEGEKETGVTVFRPDEGVDTGPIVVQRGGIPIGDADTAASLYYEKIYPVGVEAMLEAVAAVAEGRARYEPQDETEASHHPLVSEEAARIDWADPAVQVDRLVRGCDPQPGAFALRGDQKVRFYDARLLPGEARGAPGTITGSGEDGGLVVAARGGQLAVGRMRVGEGAKVPAAEAGLPVGVHLH